MFLTHNEICASPPWLLPQPNGRYSVRCRVTTGQEADHVDQGRPDDFGKPRHACRRHPMGRDDDPDVEAMRIERAAAECDFPAVPAIYDEVIATSTRPSSRWRWHSHVMIGGIDAANDVSIRFHQRLGFEPVAHFREVGHKFGRWLDLVFMQRFLDPAGARRS